MADLEEHVRVICVDDDRAGVESLGEVPRAVGYGSEVVRRRMLGLITMPEESTHTSQTRKIV